MTVATPYTTTRVPDQAPLDQTALTPRLVPARNVVGPRPAVPLSVLFLGTVAALVAAWGAAAPFAGPDFGYVADRVGAWQWSVTSACLGLGPGALALLVSLAVIAMATRTSYARRADLWVFGLVVALCGAWFVVGQYVWPVVYGSRYVLSSTATRLMWKELAFTIGPGVILVFCGATFMGWAVRRQLALVAGHYPRVPQPASPETVASPAAVEMAAPSETPATVAPTASPEMAAPTEALATIAPTASPEMVAPSEAPATVGPSETGPGEQPPPPPS